ncbi:MAG TPA: peroxidase [Thermoanaerobaculia bacterium]|nr:peroxidase [Thermoanaerobaculia bacterium]
MGEGAAEALVAAARDDYRRADLPVADCAMLDFAIRLTRQPAAMRADDLAPLRAAGLDDAAIHEVVQVVALFNYYNRLADGLGIDPEPEWAGE